jgi:hypothetical protein
LSEPFDTLEAKEAWIKEHINFLPVELFPLVDLDQVHDFTVGLALSQQDDNGSLPGQMWITSDGVHNAHGIVSRWNSPEDRLLVIRAMRRLITAPVFNLQFYSMAAEVYAVEMKANPDGSFPERKYGMNVDDPNHYELLMVLSFARSGEYRASNYRVERDPVKGDSAPPTSRMLEVSKDKMHPGGGDLWNFFELIEIPKD